MAVAPCCGGGGGGATRLSGAPRAGPGGGVRQVWWRPRGEVRTPVGAGGWAGHGRGHPRGHPVGVATPLAVGWIAAPLAMSWVGAPLATDRVTVVVTDRAWRLVTHRASPVATGRVTNIGGGGPAGGRCCTVCSARSVSCIGCLAGCTLFVSSGAPSSLVADFAWMSGYLLMCVVQLHRMMVRFRVCADFPVRRRPPTADVRRGGDATSRGRGRRHTIPQSD